MSACCPRCMHLITIDVLHARRFDERFLGLLQDRRLPAEAGFFLSSCKLIHTFGMKRPIDVVFVSALGVVCAVRPHVRPGRIVGCLEAHGVIEFPAGMAWSLGLHRGRQVLLREVQT
jgi:uncharacterized membrane protein (UPF0127 family)